VKIGITDVVRFCLEPLQESSVAVWTASSFFSPARRCVRSATAPSSAVPAKYVSATLSAASVADCRDGVPGYEAGADGLVPRQLPDQPAKTGLSALALKRHWGRLPDRCSSTTSSRRWPRAKRTTSSQPGPGDAAYLGGERSGGQGRRGSENKIPFVAAVSLSDDGHPLRPNSRPCPDSPSRRLHIMKTRDAPVAIFQIADWSVPHCLPIRGFTPHLCRALSLALCPVPASVRRLDRGGRLALWSAVFPCDFGACCSRGGAATGGCDRCFWTAVSDFWAAA